MSNYKIDDDALKVAKRGKPQMEIYRPGSGPLPRKTGEVPETILPQKDQRKFGGVGGEREKPRGPGGGGERGGGSSGPSSRVHSEVNNIVSALLKVQDSRRNNDEPTHSAGEDTLKRNRIRKPESKLYVAKPSQNQQQNVDDIQDKSVRNNNRVNSFKEGNNRATASDTNTVDRNQKSNVGKVASDRSRGGTVSDDENSNSQSLASGRNTSDRSKKLKNEKRKTKRRGGGGGARNEANRQVNGFEEQPPEKTSQPSSVQERVVSDTYESSNSNFEHANNNINTNRNMRHASEPRVLPTAHHYGHQTNENSGNRLARDTHSMEHNDWNSSVGYGGDKGKPRDHRRHIGGNKHNKPNHHSNTELPPRFQKKKQMESTMKHIGTTSADDQWDGLSLTIHQQNSSAMYSYTAPPPPPPTHHPIHHPHPMYRTIPIFHQPHAHQLAAAAAASMPTWHNQMPMSRGRGRLRAENIPRPDIDMTRNTRSLTPERHMYANEEQHRYGMSSLQDNYTRRQYDYKVDNYNSKVDSLYESRKEPSPPTHQSNDNLTPMPQQADDKPATTSHKVENDVHSIEKPEVLPNKNQTASTERLPEAVETNDDAVFKVPASNSLDWVEEIERTERLQARSDLSRSTSVNSLHETSPRPKDQGSMKKRRDSRRKKRQGGRNDERSPSRDSRHRGSQESVDQCHWRRVEKENLSWRANSHDRTTSGGSRHNSAERWQRGGGGGGREAEWFRGREGGKDKDRRGRYRNGSRERRGDRRNRRGSSELWSNKSSDETTNWRNELKPPEPRPNDTTEHAAGAVSSGANATNSTTTNSVTSQKSPGILVLPPSSSATMTKTSNTSPRTIKTPETSDESYKQQQHQQQQPSTAQRQLFNPNNPNEPIIVASPGCRAAPPPPHIINAGPYDTGQFPVQNADLDKCRNVRDQQILMDIERCEYEIGMILTNGHIEQNWPWVMDWRFKLLEMQRVLLMTKMNFCQEKNIEQRIWKAVFHNIIEFLRKMMTDFPDTSDRCKEMLLRIIQDGIKYYEDLLNLLENNYKIKFEDYLHSNPDALKDLGLNKLTLVSAQKIYLCLGDLARYKDQVNEKEHSQRGGPNYGIARQWYIKAQQMNPKNGRPYNQLAVISCYGRRKLDAVYFYMRSLMSSNPFQSAREPLLSMFDDNRKKWESCERGRGGGARQAAPSDKEGGAANRMRRREIWIRPDGGKRVLRTTSAARSKQDGVDSEEEEVEAELKNMSYVDLNKRFCVSFLHVHGKLFTKVGMESFQEAGLAMLREFRVLLQHSPLPLTVTRFLQLLALNMFAIENTQLKNTDLDPGYRSATQECALIVSLQMFNLIVERCVQLLQTADTDNQQQQQHPTPISNLTSDVHVLLPAIKVWCDWLLCHSNVWNPPPSCRDYRVGPSGDAWTRLATLVNLLEKINTHRDFLSTEPLPDSELVRLPEDVTMSGFTPLMYNTQDPIYTNGNCDMELAQISLRIHKIMFFGTEFLCGVDPPVLKLQKYETGVSEYISVVEIPSPPVQSDNEEVCIESDDSEEEVDEKGEGESDDSGKATGVEEECGESNALDISNLRKRKEQLERSHRKQERRRQKVQAIVRECEVRVEMEVRPHYLVPDTNCLIDYLSELATIANAKTPATNEYTYSLIVPLVVISELEGLSQGAGKGVHGAWRGAQHVVRLTEAARSALHFLRSTDAHPPIKGLTTHGNTLNSNRFTQEEDYSEDMKNDDKILTACLNLSRLNSKESKSQKEDGSRRVLCEVVLLTEDRNLKLKALARDMPVSDMPNFIKWAGLG